MQKLIVNSATHGTREILLDDEDYDRFSKLRWNIQCDHQNKGKYYITNSINKKVVKLHREILSGYVKVIHINGNEFDNRRSNLKGLGKKS